MQMTLREIWSLTADEQVVSRSYTTHAAMMMKWFNESRNERVRRVLVGLMLGWDLSRATGQNLDRR